MIDVSSAEITCSALRLAEPMGRGRVSPGAVNDYDRAVAVEHLELPPLGDAGLVDVSGEDELGAGCREPLQHVPRRASGRFARPPRRVRELVVEADDAQRTGRCRRRGGSQRAQGNRRSAHPTGAATAAPS